MQGYLYSNIEPWCIGATSSLELKRISGTHTNLKFLISIKDEHNLYEKLSSHDHQR